MLVILMVTEMMMLMMAMTMSMEIRMLDGPICENVLQILDMTNPKPRFWKSPDQLLLQGTIEKWPARSSDLSDWRPIIFDDLHLQHCSWTPFTRGSPVPTTEMKKSCKLLSQIRSE